MKTALDRNEERLQMNLNLVSELNKDFMYLFFNLVVSGHCFIDCQEKWDLNVGI